MRFINSNEQGKPNTNLPIIYLSLYLSLYHLSIYHLCVIGFHLKFPRQKELNFFFLLEIKIVVGTKKEGAIPENEHKRVY